MTDADIIPASNTSVHPISQDIQDLIASCNFSSDDEEEEQVTEATEPIISDISAMVQQQEPVIEKQQPPIRNSRGSRPMLMHRDSVRLMGGNLLPDEVLADLESESDDDEDDGDNVNGNLINETPSNDNNNNINDFPPISVIHVHDENKSGNSENRHTRSTPLMRRKSCPGPSLEAAAAAMRLMNEGERRRSAEGGPMPRRRSFGVPDVPITTIVALKGLSFDEEDDDDEGDANDSRGGNSSATPSTAPTTVSEGQQGQGGAVRRSSHKSAPLIGEFTASKRRNSGNISVSSRVSFDEEVKMEHIDNFKHLLKKREKYATWYSDREMNSIQIEALVERLREKEEKEKKDKKAQQKNKKSSMKKSNYSSVVPQQQDSDTTDDDDKINDNDDTKSKSSRSSRGRFSLKKKAKSLSNFFKIK